MSNPGVTALLLGARTLQQLENNLGALDVTLNAAQLEKLETVSAIDLGFPHDMLSRPLIRDAVASCILRSQWQRSKWASRALVNCWCDNRKLIGDS